MVIERLYNEQIQASPITNFALGYDEVKHHSWYDNLNYLVELATEEFKDSDLIMDYSCGTGIFGERLNKNGSNPNILMVDSSLKYLRLAYEKFKNNKKYYFRLLDLKKEIKSSLVENLNESLDGIVCANAIHLYSDVNETFQNWNKLLKKNGKVIINSGNISNKLLQTSDSVIIDETVNKIFELSYHIVETNSKYYKYLPKVNDASWNKKYVELKDRYFLPTREITFYTEALKNNGFRLKEIKTINIDVDVIDWFDFLKVYDDGILGWIGGVEKVTGNIPTIADIQNRLDIMKEALDIIFNGKDNFKASWNYIICEKI